jgi:hypothetical protein
MTRRTLLATLAIVAMLTLAWLTPGSAISVAGLESVLIRGVPHVHQQPDFCGEACAEMVLKKLGFPQWNQSEVFNVSGLDPVRGRGCHTRELDQALTRIGFNTGSTWYSVRARDSARQLHALFASLHADLKAGIPSIVCMRYDEQPEATEHFRLVLGFDQEKDEVIFHEPARASGAYQRMKRSTFLALWPLKYRADRWTVIRLRLRPGRISRVPESTGFTNADYVLHIQKLRKKLPSDEFHVVVQKPFVVVGDESLAQVRSRSVNTIKWAIDRLKKDFFSGDPDHIIDVWLFRDKTSYEENVLALFGSAPSTPYGYYSPRQRVLVMNISTGGGTLVHEIVHPFVAANFPACPAWLNEGLGSLYEQCMDHKGHIWGRTNWRLKGLQQAIVDKKVPPFSALCGTTTQQFYGEDPGTNYSQARYLCYYLQERGLLVRYYHQFRKSIADDPGGYKTLMSILEVTDMEKFQQEWEKYVMTLRF